VRLWVSSALLKGFIWFHLNLADKLSRQFMMKTYSGDGIRQLDRKNHLEALSPVFCGFATRIYCHWRF